MNNDKYQLCPCGSGKKFKFCCYEKQLSLGDLSDKELIRRAAEFQIHKCWIDAGWEDRGIAQVLVARQLPNLRYLLGVYLVDVFCLGVKSTFVRTRLKYEGIQFFLEQIPQQMQEIPYEDSRSVVMGAVEYAARFGFEPDVEWEASGWIIESGRSFKRKFEFGQDGKPCYIQGPKDDVDKIMKRLAPLVEEGRAHFSILAVKACEQGSGDGSVFDHWHDEIAGLLEANRFESAREEIQCMLKDYPERWEPLFLMGSCLGVEGKPDGAIPFLNEAISRHPSPEAYNNLGSAHKTLFHFQEWVDCLKKVIELDGYRGEYGKSAKEELNAFASEVQKTEGLTLDRYFENQQQYRQAFRQLRNGQFEEAIQGFKKVLQVSPHNVQSYGNLGLAYACLGDRETAIKYLDKAIEMDPRYQPAIDNRSIILASPHGQPMTPDEIQEIDFYGERARTKSPQTHASRHTEKPGSESRYTPDSPLKNTIS